MAWKKSRVGREFIQQLSVSNAAIFIEENSHTTQQNLTEAVGLMEQHGYHCQ